MRNDIFVKNAKENNLKGIDVRIPRDKLVVFTGVSGSGKSSLAFDTIFAEGQRRYIESLSAYARQFLGQMEKPDVEYIEGLSPAISIDQKTTSSNPRSIVGTVTEIYDYLRLLYARVGTPHCSKCGKEIARTTVDQICDIVCAEAAGSHLIIKAPVVRGRKGEYKSLLEGFKKSGYVRVEVDGSRYTLDEEIELDKNLRHDISVVIDRLIIKDDIQQRLSEAISASFKLAEDLVLIDCEGREVLYSGKYSCPDCGISMAELEPRAFSFNNPHGACPDCTGIGFNMEFDLDLIIPDESLSLRDGAVKAIGFNLDGGRVMETYFSSLAKHYGFSLDTPFKDLGKNVCDIILNGTGGERIQTAYVNNGKTSVYTSTWEGLMPMLKRRYRDTTSDMVKREYENYMTSTPCATCGGKRLKPESLAVTVGEKNIYEICQLSIKLLYDYFDRLVLDATKTKISYLVVKEIKARVKFLIDVGLDYLTLWRTSGSLSGGEAQRIRLATQVGSGLMGVLYILDEPSIGLHQRDNARLIETLKGLRDLGNTLIVVEHDEETMLAADHIIDIGVGAGVHGGSLIAEGSAEEVMNCAESVTGQFLSGKREIKIPDKRRQPNGKYIVVKNAYKNNLKNIDCQIPLGLFNVITGVSGSGKSSLVNEIIKPYLNHKLNRARQVKIDCDSISGDEYLDKVISIDQSPIGRTPRSNPATYTNVFTDIRNLFAQTVDAKERGFKSGRFSFNVSGGRCENCYGEGIIRIEMNFLPDVYVPCEVCRGKRYNRETLQVFFKGKTISDILDMTIEEATGFFENITSIRNKVQALYDVGLGYVKLGQPATTLSGGEAQRVKLASELARRSTGRTIYILDEPTTGLHAADVERLLLILQRLVSGGNTVLVIEHNLDVIKCADYCIDLGYEGGDKGGEIIAKGTPEELMTFEKSHTGIFLKKVFEKHSLRDGITNNL